VSSYNPNYYTYYNNIKLTISKSGYETVVMEDVDSLRTTGATEVPITLKKAVPLMIDSNGEAHIRFNKENIGNNRELI
jgi:fructoselysine-6-P-deglycase FrlB-like protein